MMFCVNDYVVYGNEGVCRVEDIGKPSISGLDKQKEYYTLVPFYRKGKIYTPTDSTILMRKVISKENAEALISRITEISPVLDVPRDSKLAMEFYKSLVKTHECEKLISIIKHVFEKQRVLVAEKKNVPAVDLRYMKIAEDMLYGELGFALNIKPSDVRGYIIRSCEMEG